MAVDVVLLRGRRVHGLHRGDPRPSGQPQSCVPCDISAVQCGQGRSRARGNEACLREHARRLRRILGRRSRDAALRGAAFHADFRQVAGDQGRDRLPLAASWRRHPTDSGARPRGRPREDHHPPCPWRAGVGHPMRRQDLRAGAGRRHLPRPLPPAMALRRGASAAPRQAAQVGGARVPPGVLVRRAWLERGAERSWGPYSITQTLSRPCTYSS